MNYLCFNRSSPHLSTNGVSSFSGKTRPSVIQGTVEVLTSLMQELQNSGKTDSELWKNCEVSSFVLFLELKQFLFMNMPLLNSKLLAIYILKSMILNLLPE